MYPWQYEKKQQKGGFVEYKSLLVDPLLLLKSQKLSLVCDPNTGNFDWVEKSTVHEISSFDQWLKAHTVYAAMMVDAHPEHALELVKYQNVIHDSSLCYEWDAVLLYDFHFCQVMSENLSLGVLLIQSYIPKSSLTGVLPLANKRSGKPCNQYNQGNCTWRKCRFAHRCSKCQKSGHLATQCQSMDLPPAQQQGQGQGPPQRQAQHVTQPTA